MSRRLHSRVSVRSSSVPHAGRYVPIYTSVTVTCFLTASSSYSRRKIWKTQSKCKDREVPRVATALEETGHCRQARPRGRRGRHVQTARLGPPS